MNEKELLNLELKKNLFLGYGGIEEAIQQNDIDLLGNKNFRIQPNSLDVPLGKSVIINSKHQLIEFYDGEGEEIILLPKHTLTSAIDIFYNPAKLMTSIDLRSGKGKLGLKIRPNSLQSFMRTNHEGQEYNKILVEIHNNNPNPIKLYQGDRFAQLFFHPINKKDYKKDIGQIVTNEEEAKSIAKNICEEEPTMHKNYIIFKVNDEILKFEKNFGVIDTRNKNYGDDLYKTFSTKNSVELESNISPIVNLTPKVKLPGNIALQLIPTPMINGYANKIITLTNAGLIDSGYPNPNEYGIITAHPIYTKQHTITKGEQFIVARIIKYENPIKKTYGSDGLGSNYTKSNNGFAKS